jgi:uroporphyrinogen decarboxylase
MDERARLLTALSHRQPDRVPYMVQFTVPARAAMAAYYGDPGFEERLGNCFVPVSLKLPGRWVEGKPGVWQDEFGVWWDRSIDPDIGTVCNRVICEADFPEYRFPDADDPRRYAELAEPLNRQPRPFVVANFGFSLFERAWTLFGMEALLMAMVNDKAFVHRLLDTILAFNLRVIENACRVDVDAVMFGDDWGQQRGLLMGPVLWREFIKPRIAQMYAAVKAHGKFVFIHSCGKVDAVFPDLIEIGLNVFNPFQPEVMDVFEMKRRYGDRLSFYGGISTQRLLPFGTPQQVRDEVRRLLDEIGCDGGYIAAPAHAIPGDARPENVAAMLEVLQKQ